MIWQPTMHLRARQGEVWNQTFILEQQWIELDTAKIEWRPIVKVKHDGTPYEERYNVTRKEPA